MEEPDFDEKIAKGMYRSRYDPKALKGRLESLKAKYNFEIVPMSKNMIGHNIYHRFYYQAKYYLKTGAFNMAYSREEQETTMVFDNSTGQWSVYSTVPKHIRKLNNLCELKTLEEEDGRPIAVKGFFKKNR